MRRPGGSITMRYGYPTKGLFDGAPAHAVPEGGALVLTNLMPEDRTGQYHGGKRSGIINAVLGSGIADCRALLGPLGRISGSLYPSIFAFFGGSGVYVGDEGNALTAVTSGSAVTPFVYAPCAVLRNDPDGIPAEVYYVTTLAQGTASDRKRFPAPTTGFSVSASTWDARSGGGSIPIAIGAMCSCWGKLVIAQGFGKSASFFTSKQYDGRNWDFSSNLATGAFSSLIGKAGQPGDNIHWLIPESDTRLILSCSRSMWMVDGDPKIGGRVRYIGENVVANNESWCLDGDGRLWFIGPGGLYAKAGDQIRNMDGGRVRALRETDWSTNQSVLAFNADMRRLEIFITATNGSGAAVGYFYLLDSDRFVKIETPSGKFLPRARVNGVAQAGFGSTEVYGRPQSRPGYGCHVSRGDGIHTWEPRSLDTTLTDRVVISGATTPEAITGEVRFPAFRWPEGGYEAMCTELRAYAPASCGPVSWYLITADTPDECEAKTVSQATQSGTLFSDGAGISQPISVRATGGAVQLVLKHAATNSDFRMGWVDLSFARAGMLRKAA